MTTLIAPASGSVAPKAVIRGEGRPQQYKGADGKRLPSVTTILGRFKESGGLIRWAYEQGKRAERGEIKDLYDSRDEAASIGSVVHDMSEAHIAGDVERVAQIRRDTQFNAEQIAQMENGFDAFCNWFDGTCIQISETETPLVSVEHGFAGTFDALGQDRNGKLVLLDWKTSSGLYGEYVVQIAAYAILLAERGDVVEEAHLCRFSKEFGNFTHHQITGPMLAVGREQFLLLCGAYKNDAMLKRMVK